MLRHPCCSQAGGSRHRVLPLAPGRLRPALLRSAMRGLGPLGCSRPHTHRAAARVAARLAVQATDQAARPCNAVQCRAMRLVWRWRLPRCGLCLLFW